MDNCVAGSIGERLRLLREKSGLTQLDLALRLGVGQAVISRLEKRPDLMLSTIQSYLAALGGCLGLSAVFSSGAAFDLSSGCELPTLDDNQLVLPGFLHSEQPTKDVVFSIHPTHATKILSGEKTVELRRRFNDDLNPGGLALIYSTSPTRALTGAAQIQDVQRLKLSDLWKRHSAAACLPKDDFENYFSGLDSGYAILLHAARPLVRQITLSELRTRCGFAPPQSYQYASESLRGLLKHERPQSSH